MSDIKPQVTDMQESSAPPPTENQDQLDSLPAGATEMATIMDQLEKRSRANAPYKLTNRNVHVLYEFILTGEYVRATLMAQIEALKGQLREEANRFKVPILRRNKYTDHETEVK